MLSTTVLVILFSLVLNWMISLTILFQVAEEKDKKIRAIILSLLSGFILGYIIYLL
jgi:hypothetical protein